MSRLTETISIVTPAYRASANIGGAVKSILAQTYADWVLVLVSDDGEDYEAILGHQGLADPRFRFVASSGVGTGASRARNAGLEAVGTQYVAVLDADDRFKPKKLERAVVALADHAIVSTALAVVAADGSSLRTVGAGPDRALAAGVHKWVNFSMDSMIAWDRRLVDARYDPELPNDDPRHEKVVGIVAEYHGATTHKLALHRRVGMWGMGLALLVMMIGIATAVDSAGRAQVAPGGLSFLATSL